MHTTRKTNVSYPFSQDWREIGFLEAPRALKSQNAFDGQIAELYFNTLFIVKFSIEVCCLYLTKKPDKVYYADKIIWCSSINLRKLMIA